MMNKLSKEYHYTNDMGYHKILHVEETDNNTYSCQIWSRDTGDFCGSGTLSKQELQDFLTHYGIRDDE